MKPFFRKLKWLTERRSKEADLREELQFHLDAEAEQREAEGLANDEARCTARRELGNLARLQEDTRAAWGWTMWEQLGQDLRYAFRTMAANRLFSLLAIVSLALGIGANTAIYSFMDSILLRALPVPDPDSLVVLNWHAKATRDWRNSVIQGIHGSTYDDSKLGVTGGMFPFPAYQLFREYGSVFSTLFAHYPSWQVKNLNLTIKGQAGIAAGDCVSGGYFGGLGVPPAAGRLIIPDDDRPSSATRSVKGVSGEPPTRPASRS